MRHRAKQTCIAWCVLAVFVVVGVWGLYLPDEEEEAYVPALQKKVWVITNLYGEVTGVYYGYK